MLLQGVGHYAGVWASLQRMEAKKHSQISFSFHCSNDASWWARPGTPGIWGGLWYGHHGMRLMGPQVQGQEKGLGEAGQEESGVPR